MNNGKRYCRFKKPFLKSVSVQNAMRADGITEATSLIENLPAKYVPADKDYDSG